MRTRLRTKASGLFSSEGGNKAGANNLTVQLPRHRGAQAIFDGASLERQLFEPGADFLKSRCLDGDPKRHQPAECVPTC
jgi:hypothetical protein